MREEGARRIYVLWQLQRYEIWVCTTGHSTKTVPTCVISTITADTYLCKELGGQA